jgi:sec-independent protein translocase protein TatA
VVLLLLGTKRLRNVGSDLGAAIKGFKQGLNEGTDPAKLEADPKPTVNSAEAEKEPANKN